MTQVFYSKPYLLEPIQRSFKGRSIVSMEQITAEDLYHLFAVTHHMKHIAVNKVPSSLLAGHVVSLLFFEPSTRTFRSFASAVKRLGRQTLDIQNPETVTSTFNG